MNYLVQKEKARQEVRKEMETKNICEHDFVLSAINFESTTIGTSVKQIGYSICRKCGYIKKQEIQ